MDTGERPVKTFCPECRRPVPGQIFTRNGDLFLRRNCEKHGTVETLYVRDARLHELAGADGATQPDGPVDPLDPRLKSFVTVLSVDFTSRCNLSCPTCFADAGTGDDVPMEEILGWIPDYRGRRNPPGLSILGGEPTVRKDLPEFIQAVIQKKGLVPKIATNGLALLEGDLLDRLYAAGLRWLVLQFDGFRPGPSLAFRERDLSKLKLEVIEKAASRGMFIHLAVMVQKGVNDDEIGDILRFAIGHRAIRRVSFYPRTLVGRIDNPSERTTYARDVLDAIERCTNGEVTADDVLASRALGTRIFRLTRLPMFRPRPCILPFVLTRQDGRLLSCHKLFGPVGALSNPRALLRMVRNGLSLLNPDKGFPDDFLFVNVEKFLDDSAFVYEDSQNCHFVHLSRKGGFPFCAYNTYVREAGCPMSDSGGACGAIDFTVNAS